MAYEHMNHKKFLIVIGGMLTTSRIVQLNKILKIIEDTCLFREIIIIHEGRTPLIVKNNKTKVFCTGISIEENKTPALIRILNYIHQELEKCKIILKNAKVGDFALFLGIYQPISLIFLKFRRCFTVLFGGGFDITLTIINNKIFDVLYLIFRWTFQIGMIKQFDKIILEAYSIKDFYKLNRFNRKIIYANLFIENIFDLTDPIDRRYIDLAFIGVLSKEKGIFKFLESCKILKTKNKTIKVKIWGDGILREEVESYIKENNLQSFVDIEKFVNHQYMPILLNRIKLIVIPSYSEGLPNILIEAMACGCPVLAMPVGGIPDVIKEGKTGFLLKFNDPKHIAKRIVELLNNLEVLEKVSKNAYEYVRENFSYEKTLQVWRRIIIQLEV
ncbi:MAG: glycosyltransferase [Candidatus Methanomethylicaceae archaeon]